MIISNKNEEILYNTLVDAIALYYSKEGYIKSDVDIEVLADIIGVSIQDSIEFID